VVSTVLGLLLCLAGAALLAWATHAVWRGMVRHDSPTPADRSRRANASGAHLYDASRPHVAKVRFTRRRYVGRGNEDPRD